MCSQRAETEECLDIEREDKRNAGFNLTLQSCAPAKTNFYICYVCIPCLESVPFPLSCP